MSAWMTALGVIMAYAGCVLLFQSGERRLSHPAVRVPKEQMTVTKAFGWALALGSSVPLSIPNGVERGIAYWLAVVAAAGCFSLLVSALMPKIHIQSIAIVSGLTFVAAIMFTVLGAAT